MALNALYDETKPPRDEDLAAMLGSTWVLWNDLMAHIKKDYSPVTIEWLFTSKSRGWGLRLKRGDRAILYMKPCEGYFLASFALGEKAVKAAHECGLPIPVLEIIDGAKKYAEGRGVRLEVRSAEDVLSVEKLATVKMAR